MKKIRINWRRRKVNGRKAEAPRGGDFDNLFDGLFDFQGGGPAQAGERIADTATDTRFLTAKARRQYYAA